MERLFYDEFILLNSLTISSFYFLSREVEGLALRNLGNIYCANSSKRMLER